MSKSLGGLIFGKSKNTVTTIDINDEKAQAKIEKLLKDLKKCNTTVEIGVAVDEAGLAEVEGLKQHINELHAKGQLKTFGKDDVGKFIENQNLTNIASQAHGFTGVNAAINEYNNLVEKSDGSAEKFAETIGKNNTNLGKHLKGLNGAKAGMAGYGFSLVGATAKTFALEAATMALNATISMGISVAISGLITLFNELIVTEKEAAEAALAENEERMAKFEELKQKEEDAIKTSKELSDIFKTEDWGAESAKRASDIYNQMADALEESNSADKERIKYLT